MFRVPTPSAAVVAASLLISTSALADGHQSQTNAPSPLSWTGFYVGGALGYGWGDGSFETIEEETNDLTEVVSFAAIAQAPAAPTQFDVDGNGAVFSGLLGYQAQFGALLAGIESGLTGTSVEVSGACGDNTCEADFDLIASIGGRLGITSGPVLFFVSGGYAAADISSKLVDGEGETVGATSEWHDGWYLGGGIDWQVMSKVVLGFEYRHYDFGSEVHMSDAGSNRIDASLDTLTGRRTFLLQ